MKRFLTAVILTGALGAVPEPVTWTVQSAPPPPLKAGARFNVKLVAKIQDGWHLYSMKPMAEGPLATRIWLAEGQPFTLAGVIAATEPRVMHDSSFGMEVELYEGDAAFTLPVRVAAAAPAGPQKVIVNTSYQTCDNKICLPPKTVKVEVTVTVAK